MTRCTLWRGARAGQGNGREAKPSLAAGQVTVHAPPVLSMASILLEARASPNAVCTVVNMADEVRSALRSSQRSLLEVCCFAGATDAVRLLLLANVALGSGDASVGARAVAAVQEQGACEHGAGLQDWQSKWDGLTSGYERELEQVPRGASGPEGAGVVS